MFRNKYEINEFAGLMSERSPCNNYANARARSSTKKRKSLRSVYELLLRVLGTGADNNENEQRETAARKKVKREHARSLSRDESLHLCRPDRPERRLVRL